MIMQNPEVGHRTNFTVVNHYCGCCIFCTAHSGAVDVVGVVIVYWVSVSSFLLSLSSATCNASMPPRAGTESNCMNRCQIVTGMPWSILGSRCPKSAGCFSRPWCTNRSMLLVRLELVRLENLSVSGQSIIVWSYNPCHPAVSQHKKLRVGTKQHIPILTYFLKKWENVFTFSCKNTIKLFHQNISVSEGDLSKPNKPRLELPQHGMEANVKKTKVVVFRKFSVFSRVYLEQVSAYRCLGSLVSK